MITQESLVKKAKEVAFNSINNFVVNLGLNKDNFEHLNKINITCDNIFIPFEDSIYIQKENKIVIDLKYINKLINYLEQQKVSEKVVVLDIAANIVHEMLHANRTVVEIKKENKTAEAKLISDLYELPNNIDEEEKENQKYMQGNFEEIITDALSEIIIKTRNDNELYLQETTDFIKNNTSDEGISIGVEILNKVGTETIREFMCEAYQKQVTNPFRKYFKEKYDDLLYYVSEVYIMMYCHEKIDNSVIKGVKSIIK